MNHKAVAAKLNQTQRDLLVCHVDGEAFVDVHVNLRERGRPATMKSLMDLNLIRYAGYSKLNKTRITDAGRQVLAYVLASYAEALIQAGYGIEAERAPIIAAIVKKLAHPGLSTVVTSHPPQSAPTESSAAKV